MTFGWGFFFFFILHCVPLGDWEIACPRKGISSSLQTLKSPQCHYSSTQRTFQSKKIPWSLICSLFILAPFTWNSNLSKNKKRWLKMYLQWLHAPQCNLQSVRVKNKPVCSMFFLACRQESPSMISVESQKSF